LAQWGRISRNDGALRNPLIVLTGLELFADYGIERAWKSVGEPNSRFAQHAATDQTDLYHLAETTQQLYLGLPPFFADSQTLRMNQKRIIRALKHRSKYYCVSIG
jgi:hypothetical protein